MVLWVVGMVLQVLGLAPWQTSWELMTLPVALHLAYVGYVRLVERRSPAEFARAGAVRELASGILVGGSLPAAVVGLVAALVSTVAILAAKLLLGAAYLLTRRLWMAIGVHFAWTFTQEGIFGVDVSGNEAGGLIESQLGGPDLISGGSFGVEASIFAIVIGLALGAVFLVLAHRRGNFKKPFWSTRKTPQQYEP